MNARIFRIVPCGRRWWRGSPASHSGSVSTTAGARSIPTSGSGRSGATRSTGSWPSEASRCLTRAPRCTSRSPIGRRRRGSSGSTGCGSDSSRSRRDRSGARSAGRTIESWRNGWREAWGFWSSADPRMRPWRRRSPRRSRGQAVSGCGRLSVRQAAEAIRRAVVLVTNDSAPLHFAQAVDTPTVAIFGSTVPGFGFGPRGPRDRVVQVGVLACRPCSAHGPPSCPLGHHLCMKSLSVQDVLQAIEETGALRRRD